MAEFRWTGQRERAAWMVAEDRLSNEAIAAAVGISRQAIDNWRRHPDFKARVDAHRQAFRHIILTTGIADKARRVEALHDRWQRLHQVIEARAADERHRDEPGWTTGLLVHQARFDKFGNQIDEYAIDTGLLAELRAHEKQAAQEVGDWVERKEHAGPGGGPIPLAHVDLTNATDEDLDALDTILTRLAQPGRGQGREGASSAE